MTETVSGPARRGGKAPKGLRWSGSSPSPAYTRTKIRHRDGDVVMTCHRAVP